MFQMLYLPFWFFQTRILGRKKPLQSVVFISDKCNLQCKHCCIYKAGGQATVNTYEEVKQKLEHCYKLGSRFVDFEGGEPFLWKDETNANDVKDMNSLFRLARKIGFYSTTVTTNAQINFDNCEADSIWVSLDGIGDYHDIIRGKGAFDKLVQNINSSSHSALSVNMVVNNLNYKSVKDTIEFAKNNKNIKSISINFHTPFPGTENLTLPSDIRNNVIDEVVAMKKHGYPIMNSITGLKMMKFYRVDDEASAEILNFKKYCWISNFVMVDGACYEQCQGHELNLCDKCGFCMAGEMYGVMNLKIDTILSGLRLRLKS